MMKVLKPFWQTQSAKFAALTQREKIMVIAAMSAVIGFGGYSLWVEPAQVKAQLLGKQLAQTKTDLVTLEAQLVGLRARYQDPDAANRAALADVGAQLAQVEGQLRSYDAILVPPQRVPQLLQSLLARHRGLKLVSLQTLAPAPLIAPLAKKDGTGEGKSDAKSETPSRPSAPAPGQAEQARIFKHGIELKVAGGYGDLLAYLAELEQSPQKLLWESMSLVTTAYPRNELTLRFYTLSLDSKWLVL